MRLILWGWKERARAQFPRPLPPGQPAWRDIGHADAPQQGVLHALFGRKFHQRLGRIAPRGPGRRCERSEAIHPFFLCAARWIASRSLSAGARSRDPLARNDGPIGMTEADGTTVPLTLS